ncbi:putative ATPase of the CDC48/PAS1/SEC18 family, partial [Nadsonia fulvescens var. elongata DSM 6958]
ASAGSANNNGVPSNGCANEAKAATPPVKVPKAFIVRPSKSTNAKSCLNVTMNPAVMKALGIAGGELVIIAKEGEKGVVGTSVPGDKGSEINIVLVSKPLRDLGGILLGDRIKITKYAVRPENAELVKIHSTVPITDATKLVRVLTEIGLLLPGLKFQLGENSLTIIDAGEEDDESLSIGEKQTAMISEFHGSELLWTPVYMWSSESTLEFVSKKVRVKYDLPQSVTYSSIGGLSAQISLLRSTIELPLHRPNLFSHFGIAPSRGVLLHGPPGTGKTMLLRAVANTSNAHVLTVNGPSIVSKYLGETESALRSIFEEARKYQPSIIFLDEIDALVPRRDEDSDSSESRVVATLLTLMDGMSSSGKLVIVGATNRPNAIDAALRRPGRFDREVEIGIPDQDARLDILSINMKRVPHRLSEEEIKNVASRTHGYVGADLSGLVREAVMKTIQRAQLSFDGLRLEELFVTLPDFEKALVEIRPSAMREIFLESPKIYWADIGGQEDVKQKLRETVEWPLLHPETFKNLGIKPPKGLLLYGPPGCSKTLTAKALATEAGLNFLAVKGPELFNKFVGESERAVREIFRKARAASPSIIFFDEIDALSGARSEGGSEGSSDRVLTSLLTEMDGIEDLNGVTILAATNRPEIIDSALLRPGRLDRVVYVGPPNLATRRQILTIRTKKMTLGEEVDLDYLAKITEGCSGAEVVQLCQEAGLEAMKCNIEAERVEMSHFEEAANNIQRNITPEMIEFY